METLSSKYDTVEELIQISLTAAEDSPPTFQWDDWYASVGGRSINIPEVDALRERIQKEQYPRFDGPVATYSRKFSSPDEAASHIKSKAEEFGADIVGVCLIEPSDIYRGKSVTKKFAIAVGQRMKYKEFQVVPSRESAIECMRICHSLGETVVRLAEYIRSLGYPCRVEHPIGDSNILHLPIGLKAGFGELGRHGSIIHPRIGPLFRMGSVITNLEMAIDHPIDAGIAKFCDNCRACRIYCPADAIPDERDPNGGKDHLGYDRYVVDTGKCFPYFAKHNYCSICLPVCVYNHKEWARDFDGFETRIFPEVLMLPPPSAVDLPEEKRHYYKKIKR